MVVDHAVSPLGTGVGVAGRGHEVTLLEPFRRRVYGGKGGVISFLEFFLFVMGLLIMMSKQ